MLFDLDDTLVMEERAAAASFAATAQAARERYELDAGRLATAARVCARELWYAAPTHAYCLRVGISSWEGLWCRFEGGEANTRWLRAWSPTYRRDVWSGALAAQGIHDRQLAQELAERYGEERRRRHDPFPDALECLQQIRGSFKLGLITNGASCLQREKLAGVALGDCFDAVIVSAEFGVGKPDPLILRHAVEELGVEASEAAIVGDSLERDVHGALAAGLRAIWLNRDGARSDGHGAVPEIATLVQLPDTVRSLG